MSVTNKNLVIYSYLAVIPCALLYRGIGIDSFSNLFNILFVFLLYPLVVSVSLIKILIASSRYSFKSSFLLTSLVLVVGELIAHISHFIRTDVNLFNDPETGSVGMLILFIQFSIMIVAIKLFGEKEYI
ncbi:hypothetical protein BST96_14360 [Oceanicoccus sagamiensis]|uniref:Uncharacterized protein n=1 Tax=Oceanicoccus sagamiensis TaxID=716816 RepID=A0A1X9NDR2_9GAMM|nr:hypothetical protein BST96_14360 [Oceanicoccus sagamiensis]